MKKEKYTLRKNNCNNCNCNARPVFLPLKSRKTIGYNPNGGFAFQLFQFQLLFSSTTPLIKDYIYI